MIKVTSKGVGFGRAVVGSVGVVLGDESRRARRIYTEAAVRILPESVRF
jgi:hypothetical protein